MTPPTPDIAVSEERVKELRESVRTGRVIISGDAKDLSTLINIVEGYSSLRAENERLKENVQRCEENYAEALYLASTYQETAEKAEAQLAAANKELEIRTESHRVAMAEVERLKEDCDRTADVVVEQMAQLAKQAPLVNALLRIANEAFPLEVTEKCMRSVARAALKLWEGEGKCAISRRSNGGC